MRVMPYYSKVLGVSNAEMLDTALGPQLPALTSDFEVWMGADFNLRDIGAAFKGKAFKKKYLFSCMDIAVPKVGYSFKNKPSDTGFIEASVLSGEAVRVAYWDTATMQETAVLMHNYNAQLSEYGSLRFDYKVNWLHIRIGTQLIELKSGAMTKPRPTSVSSATNNLLQMEFEFSYEDYEVGMIEFNREFGAKYHSNGIEQIEFV